MYVLKEIDVADSQEIGGVGFRMEVEALKSLGRLVKGTDVLVVGASEDGGKTEVKLPIEAYPESGDGEADEEEDADDVVLLPSYPPGTKAYFFQHFMTGKPITASFLHRYHLHMPRLRDRIVEQVKIVNEAGWMHRDLNPRNILVEPVFKAKKGGGLGGDTDFVVNIVDFGSAVPYGMEPNRHFDLENVEEDLWLLFDEES